MVRVSRSLLGFRRHTALRFSTVPGVSDLLAHRLGAVRTAACSTPVWSGCAFLEYCDFPLLRSLQLSQVQSRHLLSLPRILSPSAGPIGHRGCALGACLSCAFSVQDQFRLSVEHLAPALFASGKGGIVGQGLPRGTGFQSPNPPRISEPVANRTGVWSLCLPRGILPGICAT